MKRTTTDASGAANPLSGLVEDLATPIMTPPSLLGRQITQNKVTVHVFVISSFR